MEVSGEGFRFWLSAVLLVGFAGYTTQQLVRSHLDPEVLPPKYTFERKLAARRGSIFASSGRESPLVRSVSYWEYRLDPVDLTNAVAHGIVRRKKEPPRTKEQIVQTISQTLGLPYEKLLRKVDAPPTRGWRSQPLDISMDNDVYRTLADSSLVRGVAIGDKQVREYLNGRFLSHVLGSLNAEEVGSAGIEQRFNTELSGLPGVVQGKKDAHGHELYDKRIISVRPKPGCDIYLTIDTDIQLATERALKWGLRKYDAASGWVIVMDSATGAIYAMASLPDFDPLLFGRASESAKINRAVAYVYEPGSIMKVLTAAAAIDYNPKRYGPNTVYSTRRDEPGYYRLPSDGTHDWVRNPRPMTLREAIVDSSNIVIGKLAFDLGAETLYDRMRRFGLGQKTGIELPGEEAGILPNPRKRPWDMASRSRAGIGQFVAVTAIQMASAYQAIANGGVRMQPHLVDRIVDSDGKVVYRHEPHEIGRPVSARTASTVREMMRGVATRQGTARRAAMRGYSIAGKTGTAQKPNIGRKGYSGCYRASFCGIVPAGDPRLVIFVTLDFERKNYPNHQGGVSAAPVFKRIALAATRYLNIPPDCPEELDGEEASDDFDRLLESDE